MSWTDVRLPLRGGGSLFYLLQTGLHEPDIFALSSTFVWGCICVPAQVGAVHKCGDTFATPSFEF